MKPLALTACEYGPMALGPFSVAIISLIESPVWWRLRSVRGKPWECFFRKATRETGYQHSRLRHIRLAARRDDLHSHIGCLAGPKASRQYPGGRPPVRKRLR